MASRPTTISVVTNCKNAARTIARCVSSVLAIDAPVVQVVVQDAASTDGTLEILNHLAAASRGRLELVSEPDRGQEEGYLRALRRCRGDLVLTCLADEMLLPGAARWAVDAFARHPDAAAVYGDTYFTTIDGTICGEFLSSPAHDFLRRYLCAEVVPPLAATCFRRECLEAVGLHRDDWRLDCGEMEIWLRLATAFPVAREPGFVSCYAVHDQSLTRSDLRAGGMIERRIALLRDAFADPARLGRLAFLADEAVAGQHLWWVESLLAIDAFAEARPHVARALALGPNRRRLADVMDTARQRGVALLDEGDAESARECLDLAASGGIELPNLGEARERARAMSMGSARQKHPETTRPARPVDERFLAEAWWNQRHVLADAKSQIMALAAAVGRPTDLHPFQWGHLMAFALEFRPDLIVELGRGLGNSTCAFTEVANRLRPDDCSVASICMSADWEQTAARVARVVPSEWWRPLRTFQADILTFPFEDLFARHERVLLFWDAHGFDVAECVLGEILPLLEGRAHAVVMHDISDARHLPPSAREYAGHRLWRANDWSGPRVCLGDIDSAVEQAVSIFDFISRNSLTLFSADHSLATVLGSDATRLDELHCVLGADLTRLDAHWRWFTLDEHGERKRFPTSPRPARRAPIEIPAPVSFEQAPSAPRVAHPGAPAAATSRAGLVAKPAGGPAVATPPEDDLLADPPALQARIGARLGRKGPITPAELQAAADRLAALLGTPDLAQHLRENAQSVPATVPALVLELADARRARGDVVVAEHLAAIHRGLQPL